MNPEQRLLALQAWLKLTLNLTHLNLTPLAGDASFRHYYRLQLSAEQSYIIMDAPPGLEDVKPFITMAHAFGELGVCVPQILAAESEQGFIILTDFGDRLYLAELTETNADHLYKIALNALTKIQSYSVQSALPVFGQAAMQRELAAFEEWFLIKHVQLAAVPTKLLQSVYDLLLFSAQEQPQCCIHCDYHSRNLMVLPNEQVGVIDFQDAAWGPITYDIISLLKDSYIAWPRNRVIAWAQDFWQQSVQDKRLPAITFEQYLRWFDFMALQRHLKVLFIFARKWHRDGSHHYLADIPRTLSYAIAIASDYPELHAFHHFLVHQVAPNVLPGTEAA